MWEVIVDDEPEPPRRHVGRFPLTHVSTPPRPSQPLLAAEAAPSRRFPSLRGCEDGCSAAASRNR